MTLRLKNKQTRRGNPIMALSLYDASVANYLQTLGAVSGFLDRGLAHFREYLQSPSLLESAWNTVWVASVVTLITVPLAFTFAYALTRSCMPGRGVFRLIALTPILAPSMLAAISFIQWFGNQGALKGLLMGHSVYGPIGIIISAVYAIFPHALMIVITAMLLADRRLFEAAESLDVGISQVLHDHAAVGALRDRQRRDGRVLLHRQRFQHRRSSAAISTCWRSTSTSR
jgi:ABC-type Fe3+ transport system permease subunit